MNWVEVSKREQKKCSIKIKFRSWKREKERQSIDKKNFIFPLGIFYASQNPDSICLHEELNEKEVLCLISGFTPTLILSCYFIFLLNLKHKSLIFVQKREKENILNQIQEKKKFWRKRGNSNIRKREIKPISKLTIYIQIKVKWDWCQNSFYLIIEHPCEW